MNQFSPIYKSLFRKQIITSPLDNDAYKIHMMQVVFEKYPNAQVEYEFKCRIDEDLRKHIPEIREQINMLEKVTFTEDQINYLSKKVFLKKAFLAALRNFQFHPEKNVFISEQNDEMKITVKGTWFQAILYEIVILAIVSEVRNKSEFGDVSEEVIRKVLFEKVEYLMDEIKSRGLENCYKFIDFGTRRRFSYKVQELVVQYLKQAASPYFIGTSNYHMAREYDLNAVGTMAHEYLCAHQAIVNPMFSQEKALEAWDDVYRGHLGIALTDSITTDAFLKIFDLSLAKRFDGVRHDSNCPYTWGEKFIKHYEKLNIDPMTKTLVFSDSLNFEKSLDLSEHFKGRAGHSFGIGTFLTNDLGEYFNAQGIKYRPLNIVMKLMKFNGHPIAKISDEPAKSMCPSPEYLAYLKSIFNVSK